MNGQRPNVLIRICWVAISPIFILIIWVFSWYDYQPIKYGTKSFSTGALVFGWSVALISIISIPAGAVHTFLNTSQSKSLIEVNSILFKHFIFFK
jgi:solute carrier family 6 dopamine transporter-like protein 3